MSAHAKLFSPSKAEQIMNCPASIAMSVGYPNDSSEYADEGTAAHEVASASLIANTDVANFLGKTIEVKNDDGTLRRKFECDAEMVSNVEIYVNYCRDHDSAIKLYEQKVGFSQTIDVPDQFGTADAILFNPDTGHVTVVDLKYGMGEQVYAANNKQMLSYAAGVLETFGDVLGEFKTFQLVICQPRKDWIDEWPRNDEPPLDVSFIRRHGEAMKTAAQQMQICLDIHDRDGKQAVAEAFPMYFNPGEKTCRWCPYLAHCDAAADKVSKEVYDAFPIFDDPAEVIVRGPPEPPTKSKLGAKYGALGFIEDWCKAVRSACEAAVLAGEEIIGPDMLPMKVVEGKKGDRAWTDETLAEARLIGVLSPEKAYSPRKIITPSAAGKLLDKKKTKAQWESFQDIIKQAPGKPKVALGSSTAPTYKGEAKSDEFPDLEVDPLS